MMAAGVPALLTTNVWSRCSARRCAGCRDPARADAFFRHTGGSRCPRIDGSRPSPGRRGTDALRSPEPLEREQQADRSRWWSRLRGSGRLAGIAPAAVVAADPLADVAARRDRADTRPARFRAAAKGDAAACRYRSQNPLRRRRAAVSRPRISANPRPKRSTSRRATRRRPTNRPKPKLHPPKRSRPRSRSRWRR